MRVSHLVSFKCFEALNLHHEVEALLLFLLFQ
jgi:hypothetical protein